MSDNEPTYYVQFSDGSRYPVTPGQYEALAMAREQRAVYTPFSVVALDDSEMREALVSAGWRPPQPPLYHDQAPHRQRCPVVHPDHGQCNWLKGHPGVVLGGYHRSDDGANWLTPEPTQ